MKFKCDNCGKETKVGKSTLALQCQTCGSYDLRFDCTVEVFPMTAGMDLGKRVMAKKGESFYGQNPSGLGWVVKNHGELEVTTVPVSSEGSEEKLSEEISDDNKQAKKLKLTKAIRQLRSPIEVRGVV